ncbi:MAG TPA: hypothetical protein VN538_08515 [Clostridia bacterium]|nr:hypothetical protein [Clostridia bacterium]
MQTTPPNEQDFARWKQIYAEYRPRLAPNRISGAALYAYLDAHYPLLMPDDPCLGGVVTQNILANESLARQLPQGSQPEPVCAVIEPVGAGLALYRAQDAVFAGCEILVGIDLVSGYFLVEGSSLLWDELYARRGLNEDDLNNVYSVAEYISCLKRFGMLEHALLKE